MCRKEENVGMRYFRWSVFGSASQNRQYVNILKFSSKNGAKKLRKRERNKTVGHLRHEGRKPNPSENTTLQTFMLTNRAHCRLSQDFTHILFLFCLFFGARHKASQHSRLTTLIILHIFNFFPLLKPFDHANSCEICHVGLLLQTAGAWSHVPNESSHVCLWRTVLLKHRLKSSVVSHVFKTN